MIRRVASVGNRNRNKLLVSPDAKFTQFPQYMDRGNLIVHPEKYETPTDLQAKVLLLLSKGENLYVNNGCGRGKTTAGLCFAINRVLNISHRRDKSYLKEVNGDSKKQPKYEIRKYSTGLVVVPNSSLLQYYRTVISGMNVSEEIASRISYLNRDEETAILITTPKGLSQQLSEKKSMEFFRGLKFVMLENAPWLFRKKKKELVPKVLESIAQLKQNKVRPQFMLTGYQMNNVGTTETSTKLTEITEDPISHLGGTEVVIPLRDETVQLEILIQNESKFKRLEYKSQKYQGSKLFGTLFQDDEELKFENYFWDTHRKTRAKSNSNVILEDGFISNLRSTLTLTGDEDNTQVTIVIPNEVSSLKVRDKLDEGITRSVGVLEDLVNGACSVNVINEQDMLHVPISDTVFALGIDSARHLHVLVGKSKHVKLMFPAQDFDAAEYHMLERLLVKCGVRGG